MVATYPLVMLLFPFIEMALLECPFVDDDGPGLPSTMPADDGEEVVPAREL
jgi:hypothetical protein